MKTLLLAAGLTAMTTLAHAQDKPVLTVYTYDSFVTIGERDNARGGSITLLVRDDRWLVAVHDGDNRVSRTEIDADDFFALSHDWPPVCNY